MPARKTTYSSEQHIPGAASDKQDQPTPSAETDTRFVSLNYWRGEMPDRLHRPIYDADPVVEKRNWRALPYESTMVSSPKMTPSANPFAKQ